MILDLNNPLILISTITGVIFIISGYIMYKFPPKNINSLYGYRTSSSMKSQERWDFAQKYAAQKMIKLGFLLTLTALVGFMYRPTQNTGLFIGLSLVIIFVVILIWQVEKAIKSKFKQS